MNRSKIEWTDYTWNPVTGCWGPEGTAKKPNRCSYCYAEKMANRFYERAIDRGKVINDKFIPLFHPERLNQPAKVTKPSKIFVCSMGDLFGEWVPTEWIIMVLQIVRKNPYHIFQFLTKNPRRLKAYNNWPSNCWVGATITNQPDADERLPQLLQVNAPVRFVSHEPLLAIVNMKNPWFKDGKQIVGTWERHVDWAIIGAMTGPDAMKPDPEWVQGLVDQYHGAGVPIFLKNNLNWPKDIQEWPF